MPPMFIAEYTPTARLPGRPSGKLVVINDKAVGATIRRRRPAWRGKHPRRGPRVASQQGGNQRVGHCVLL
jgi:hypothetical protein